MNYMLSQIVGIDCVLNTHAIKNYQYLSMQQKREFLNELKNYAPKMSYETSTPDRQDFITTFFLDEYLTLGVKFKDTNAYHALLNFFFSSKVKDDKENLESKKRMIEQLTQKESFNITDLINGFPLTHLFAIHNDLKTIEYIMDLGAPIDIIDKSGDSFASSSLYMGENIEVFKFAINQPSFNPNLGTNILTLALNHGYEKSIQAIIDSPNHLLSNEKFINDLSATDQKFVYSNMMPLYEKFLFKDQFTSSKNTTKIKL
jgi:hypothetical protein